MDQQYYTEAMATQAVDVRNFGEFERQLNRYNEALDMLASRLMPVLRHEGPEKRIGPTVAPSSPLAELIVRLDVLNGRLEEISLRIDL